MKARELVRQVLEYAASEATVAAVAPVLAADEGLELEVCVHNADIHFLSVEPAYYDGPLQRLVRDETVTHYNIVGAEFIRQGSKLVLHVLTVEDALWDNPDLPVDFTRCGGGSAHYEQQVAARREEVKRDKQDMQNELFLQWVERKLGLRWNEHPDGPALKAAALAFAEAELPFTMTLDPDLHRVTTRVSTGNPQQPTIEVHLSANEKWEQHWDRHVQLDLVETLRHSTRVKGQLRLRYRP